MSALGSPSCRPEFVEEDGVRGVLDFKTLRHPCIETTTNFIPNDISLGGFDPAITLLTGANAAGKSIVLAPNVDCPAVRDCLGTKCKHFPCMATLDLNESARSFLGGQAAEPEVGRES